MRSLELSAETQDKINEAKAKYLGKLVRGTHSSTHRPAAIGIVTDVSVYGILYGDRRGHLPDYEALIIRLNDEWQWLNQNITWEVYGDRTG